MNTGSLLYWDNGAFYMHSSPLFRYKKPLALNTSPRSFITSLLKRGAAHPELGLESGVGKTRFAKSFRTEGTARSLGKLKDRNETHIPCISYPVAISVPCRAQAILSNPTTRCPAHPPLAKSTSSQCCDKVARSRYKIPALWV